MVCEEITSGQRSVFLFGSKHSDDPNQLNMIKDSIENFNPDVVLVEGNFDKANFSSVEDSIKHSQEMGYTVFLCNEKNIPLLSNDPPFEDEQIFIENKYGAETRKLYFLLRSYSPQNSNDKTKEKITVLLKKILGENFNVSKNYSDYFNPTMSINLFNKITQELNKFRDNHMLPKLCNLLKKYSKIFIIKGDCHLSKNLLKIKEIVNGT